MGCLWTGVLVILALGLILPYCAFIPKASLAAVIITAVIFSVEYEVVRPMWRSKSKILVITRKYPLRRYILGVLTHTTALDWLWGGDETLTMWF